MSKMNNKMRLSITIIILVPVFILGALAIFSNTAAISNLKKVNKTAMTIADEHMVNISELSEIEKELQEIHKKRSRTSSRRTWIRSSRQWRRCVPSRKSLTII